MRTDAEILEIYDKEREGYFIVSSYDHMWLREQIMNAGLTKEEADKATSLYYKRQDKIAYESWTKHPEFLKYLDDNGLCITSKTEQPCKL